MDDISRHLVYGVLLPLCVASAAVLLPRGAWLRARTRLAAAIGVAAVAVPMPIAFALINGSPSEKWERLIAMTLVGAIAGAVVLYGKTGPGRIWAAGAFASAMATMIVWPIFQPADTVVERLLPGACIMLLIAGLEPLARRDNGAVVPISLWIAAMGTGIGILWMGQLPFAAAVAPIGASMLTLGVASGFGRPVATRGIVAAGAPALLMASALAYLWMSALGANYAMWLAIVPAAAALAAWVVRVPWVMRRQRWMQCGLGWLAVALISAGAVLGMTLLDQQGSSQDFDYDLPDFMRMPGD